MARVLLVDDERVLLTAISRILADAGYEMVTASSGAGAITVLSGGDPLPDLIITDVMMEDVDGLQLYAFARQNPALADIPFIFVSASAKPELEKMIAGSTSAVFLRKPFEVEALLERVAQALK